MSLSQLPNSIWVLQNDAAEGPGLLEHWASARGIRIVLKLAQNCFAGGQPPDLSTNTPVLLLGGATSVVAPPPDSWLSAEIAWIQRAIARKIPVMGICLGAQILAKALGAAVQPLQQQEAGWCALRLAPSLQMQGLRNPLTVLQWHEDGFALPSGCAPLGHSPACPQQGFIDRTRALLGVQFHPEWHAEQLKSLIDANAPKALHEALNDSEAFDRQAALLDRLMQLWLKPEPKRPGAPTAF